MQRKEIGEEVEAYEGSGCYDTITVSDSMLLAESERKLKKMTDNFCSVCVCLFDTGTETECREKKCLERKWMCMTLHYILYKCAKNGEEKNGGERI